VTVTLEGLQLGILVCNSILVPCAIASVRLMWRMERRIYRVELKLKLDEGYSHD
jgi:hypothetical protein